MFAFLSIVGSIIGFIGAQKQSKALEKAESRQREAAEESKVIANKNAARIEMETRETLRRERNQSESEQSLARARAAASGGTTYGSTGNYLDTQKEEDELNLNWIERSGSSRADIAKSEGNYSWLSGMAAADATGAQATSAKWSGISSLIGGAQDVYSFSG